MSVYYCVLMVVFCVGCGCYLKQCVLCGLKKNRRLCVIGFSLNIFAVKY